MLMKEMFFLNCIAGKLRIGTLSSRIYSTKIKEQKFETVFTFPFVKHIALFNRLKLYHLFGSSVAIPSCGLLEMFSVLPEQSFLSAVSIGVTGLAALSVASLPFKNVIGFIYISEDNQHVKISSVNYWGKREDRIISADDWMPLLDMGPNKMDAFYLSPHLTDNTRYKLFVRFGKVLNAKKMGQVLE